MTAGHNVIPAPKHRQEVEPWSSILSLVETHAMACALKPDPVKLHKVAPQIMDVETGFDVNQGSVSTSL